MINILNKLPTEILLFISDNFDDSTINQLVLTCRAFHELLDHKRWTSVVIDVRDFYGLNLSGTDTSFVFTAPDNYLSLSQQSSSRSRSRKLLNADNMHDITYAIIKSPYEWACKLAATKYLSIIMPMYSQDDLINYDIKSENDITRVIKSAPHCLVYWLVTKLIPSKCINLEKIHVYSILPRVNHSVKNTAVEVMLSKLGKDIHQTITLHVEKDIFFNRTHDNPASISPRLNHQFNLKYMRIKFDINNGIHKTLNDLCGNTTLPSSLERLDFQGSLCQYIDASFLSTLLSNCTNLKLICAVHIFVENATDSNPWIPSTVTSLILTHAGPIGQFKHPNLTHLAHCKFSHEIQYSHLFPNLEELHIFSWNFEINSPPSLPLLLNHVYVTCCSAPLEFSNLFSCMAAAKVKNLHLLTYSVGHPRGAPFFLRSQTGLNLNEQVPKTRQYNYNTHGYKFDTLTVQNKGHFNKFDNRLIFKVKLPVTSLAAITHKLYIQSDCDASPDAALKLVSTNLHGYFQQDSNLYTYLY